MHEPPPAPGDGAPPDLEELVARAIELLDGGDAAALQAWLAHWPNQAAEIQRVLRYARSNGLVTKPMNAAFPERLGDFRLVRRLGAGGMGVVFEAEQESLRRRVAVKLIRADLLYVAGARERFRREVDAVARLQHPAIVPVLAVGEAAGVPYFVMELVRGCGTDVVVAALTGQQPDRLTARTWRQVAGQVAGAAHPANAVATESDSTEVAARSWFEECVRLARAVAEAMVHAHAAGIVHRDLKPSNVMVTLRGDAQVVDFGLAHIEAAQRVTRTGSQQGSPAYMSPEQLLGMPVDERTDVYSLGVTLYEWLTLRVPFPASTVPGVRDLVLRGECAPLRRHHRGVPRDLEIVCRKAMDVDRERRYASMAAFAADLEAILTRRPIAARPARIGVRLWRWAQRHRASSAAAGVAVVAVLLFPLLLWHTQRQANEALAAEYARAERSLEVSLEAVERMLVSLGDSDLAETPGSERVRARVLQDAVDLHRRLQMEQPAHGRMQLARSRALYCQATALVELGRLDEARPVFTELAEGSVDEGAASAAPVLWQQARASCGLALLELRALRLDDCARHCARARQALAQVATRMPGSENVRHLLADVLHAEGTRAGLAGDVAGRAQAWQEALALLRAAIAVPEHAVEDDLRFAVVGGSWASAMAEAGDTAAAVQLFAETVAVLERIPEPRSVKARRLLAINLGLYGSSLHPTEPAAAIEVHRRSLLECERLHRDYPRTAFFTRLLTGLRCDHAGLLRDTDPPAAVQLAAQALADLVQVDTAPGAKPEPGLKQLGLSIAETLHDWHLQDGRPEAAAALAEQLGSANLPWADPFVAAQRFVAAAGAARAAGHEAAARPWLEQAMALLHALDQRGWPDGRSLAGDDFTLLADRTDFVELRERRSR